MPDETKTIILTQAEDDRLALDHDGALALYGSKEQPALQHNVGGQVIHGTAPKHPLVHMVCWDSEDACKVEVAGRVTLAGDEHAPLPVHMTHRFPDVHRQHHSCEPMDCTVHIPTRLAEPIHHALQLRTPLQVRFCNSWHVASDYTVEVRLRDRPFLAIRLTGATVATPQPCEDDPCPPPVTHTGRP